MWVVLLVGMYLSKFMLGGESLKQWFGQEDSDLMKI